MNWVFEKKCIKINKEKQKCLQVFLNIREVYFKSIFWWGQARSFHIKRLSNFVLHICRATSDYFYSPGKVSLLETFLEFLGFITYWKWKKPWKIT